MYFYLSRIDLSVLETAMTYLFLNIFFWYLQVLFSTISQSTRLSYFLPEIGGLWCWKKPQPNLIDGQKSQAPLCVWPKKNSILLAH